MYAAICYEPIEKAINLMNPRIRVKRLIEIGSVAQVNFGLPSECRSIQSEVLTLKGELARQPNHVR